ncbi:probable elongation factor 1-gamma [Orbicella faveolata]|nr:probable elongation factor 1-gamma [Orbicella faveolata]
MDEFKRTYSNKDTETVAIPHFWEHFNKEDFSVWLAEYQYNEELKRVFMACNLVGGMFQRLEKLHKTAFASVCVFGKDGDVSISGIWICRTQELAFRLNEDWNIDAPSYKFTKLDVDNPDHKKIINEYLLMEGDFGGKTFNQGKIFK